jgi:hypothetical protein
LLRLSNRTAKIIFALLALIIISSMILAMLPALGR